MVRLKKLMNPTLGLTYDSAKGYELSVYVVDSNHCASIPIVCRVVVAGNPFQQINNPPPLCVGDTTAISVATLPATPHTLIAKSPANDLIVPCLFLTD